MIEWTPKTTRQPREISGPRWSEVLSSGVSWTGMRLEEGKAEAMDLPEGHLRTHLVGMHLGRPSRHERSVPGQRPQARTFAPEDVSVMPAGFPFIDRLVDPAAALVVQFEPEFVSNVVGMDIASERTNLCYVYCVRDPLIAHLLYALHKDAREGTPFGPLYGESLGSSLVVHLLRKHVSPDRGSCARKRGLGAGRLRRVVEYINDCLEKDLSLAELAAVVGLSPDHFARAFKQTTATSAHRYVLLKRIERACALLRDPQVPIVEIAVRCGFSGQSSFTTSFRRVKRVTPRAYRNAWHRAASSDPLAR